MKISRIVTQMIVQPNGSLARAPSPAYGTDAPLRLGARYLVYMHTRGDDIDLGTGHAVGREDDPYLQMDMLGPSIPIEKGHEVREVPEDYILR